MMKCWIYFNGYMFNIDHVIYKKKTDYCIEIGTNIVTISKTFNEQDDCDQENDQLNEELGI